VLARLPDNRGERRRTEPSIVPIHTGGLSASGGYQPLVKGTR
jgi:hypothetical protein